MTLRGALFGLGRMGSYHAARLRERAGVSFVVVDPALGHELPRGLVENLDFAIIATPADTHLTVALPLLEAGVPCLVEKPLATTTDEARVLAAFPRLSVGHIERYNPVLDAVAEARPRFVQAERLAPFPARGADVDVLADLMIHDLDLVRTFLPGAVRDVRAVGVGVISGSLDIANARLELGGGVAQLNASRVSREPVRKLRLVEDGLYWSLDLRARTVARVRWGEGALDAEPLPVAEGDALVREHDAFFSAVRGERPWPVPGSEGLAALELVEAVRAAIAAATVG